MNIILYSAATSLILTSSKSSLIKSSKLRYLGNVILLREVNEKQIFQCMLEKSHYIVTLNQTSLAHVHCKIQTCHSVWLYEVLHSQMQSALVVMSEDMGKIKISNPIRKKNLSTVYFAVKINLRGKLRV